MLQIPFNRFVTFIKPWINAGAATLAAYVVAKANILGIPGLGSHQNELATGLAAAGIGVLTWAGAQLGDWKWLKGHHIELAGDAAVKAALITAPGDPRDTTTRADPHEATLHVAIDGREVTRSVADAAREGDEDLPSDDEEFAEPPPADDSAVPDNPDNGDNGHEG